jgi:hypothetical protein
VFQTVTVKQASAIGRMVEKHGLATVLSMGLVGFLVFVYVVRLAAIESAIERHVQQNEKQVQLLRLICIGVADDITMRVECQR